MNDEQIDLMAEQAWERYEFNSGVEITQANYDAVRKAFIVGYTQCAWENL